jgi:hypothetical protein
LFGAHILEVLPHLLIGLVSVEVVAITWASITVAHNREIATRRNLAAIAFGVSPFILVGVVLMCCLDVFAKTHGY